MRASPIEVAAVRLTAALFSFQTGGSERVGASVAQHLKRRGMPVSACATHGPLGPISTELEADGIRCTALQEGRGGRIGRGVRLYRHLKAHGTTIVHVQHFNMLASVFTPARLAGVHRIVVTEHTDHDLRRSFRSRAIARRYGGRADAVTVVHHGLADYLVDEVGLSAEDVHVIPNGVDTKRFRPDAPRASLRRDLGLSDSTVLVGSVGRLHPDKDPLNLVHALVALEPADRALMHVVLVGEGECREAAERLIDQESLRAHISLVGERRDVAMLLPALDVFALPSRTEGLPIALLEAMSCGLPLVATDVGGVAAVVGEAGLVVPPGDPSALGDGLLKLARDSDLRTRLGGMARRRAVERYDLAATFARYRDVLIPGTNTRHRRELSLDGTVT